MSTITIGVDLGQRVDPTALCVAEPERRTVKAGAWRMPTKPGHSTGSEAYWQPDRIEETYLVRYLERLPLGTSYPDVAERLAEVVANVQARKPSRIYLYADATGSVAGIDLLKEALHNLPVKLVPITFTHGDNLTRTANGWSLGKARLVSRLQALLQSQRIKLPKASPEADALTRELLDYEIKVDQNANDTYGAFKVGSHDDLVTALGLATIEEKLRPVQGSA